MKVPSERAPRDKYAGGVLEKMLQAWNNRLSYMVMSASVDITVTIKNTMNISTHRASKSSQRRYHSTQIINYDCS